MCSNSKLVEAVLLKNLRKILLLGHERSNLGLRHSGGLDHFEHLLEVLVPWGHAGANEHELLTSGRDRLGSANQIKQSAF